MGDVLQSVEEAECINPVYEGSVTLSVLNVALVLLPCMTGEEIAL